MDRKARKPDQLRIIALITFVFVAVYAFQFLFIPKTIPSFLRVLTPKNKLNLLLIGVDVNYDDKNREIADDARSDTIMFAQIDPFMDTIKIISIPRDSFVEIPGAGKNRINSAYSYGSVALLIQTVEKLLDLKIDKYLIVNTKGFAPLVDILGGVDIFVEKNLNYNDNWGHLHINLKKGMQNLNGKQAEGYVRFRHDALGDISRVDRQKDFMKAVIKKLANPLTTLKMPLIISQIKRSISTDLSFGDLSAVGNFMRMSSSKKIMTYTLPGNFASEEGSSSYWFPDKKNIKSLLEQIKAK